MFILTDAKLLTVYIKNYYKKESEHKTKITWPTLEV